MKFKSKSLISIILSIMMVISMIIVAIPANAAVVDNKPVGADTTYYLWYKTGGDDLSTDMNQSDYVRRTMTTNGNSLSVTFDIAASTVFVAYINSDPDTITSNVVQFANKKDSEGAYDNSSFAWADFGSDYKHNGYYFIKAKSSVAMTVKVTYDTTTKYLTLSKDDGTTSTETTETTEATTTTPATGEWFLIGGSGIGNNIFGNYDLANTAYPLSGTGTVLSRSVTFASGTTFFRIHDKSKQYNLSASDNAEIGDKNNQKDLVENSSYAIYFSNKTDSSLTVNICLDTSTRKVWYESATVPTEPTTTEPVETTEPTTTPVSTSGDFNIVDKTDANGTLSFTTEGKDSGTASAGDLVTVTATPDKYFECTTIVVTYKDSKKVSHNIDAIETESNKFTFTVPSGLTKADIKDQEISVTGTFVLTSTGKADYIKDQGDGLWIDVAPNENDTTATLIKWNNYSGNNHNTSTNPYTFYVPKNVDLANAKVYNGFDSEVKLNGVSIPANNCNTVTLSLTAGTTYNKDDNNTHTVKVMQGSTDAMFFTTSTSLPTAISSIASGVTVTTDDDAKKYKEQINYLGGSCKTMSNDTATANFSNALGLSSIKGRGNSSWKASAQVFGKYAFNMKLSSKTSLLGMDSAKSWCLLANNADESMMRNALTYQLAKEIGLPDSPEFRFVDIYDNGEYMGAYLVTEKVDVGKSKLVKGESFEDLNEDAVKAQGGTEIDETLSKGATYSFTDSQGHTYSNLSMRYATVGTNTGSSPFVFDSKGKYLLEFEISERVTDEPSYFVSPHGQNVVVKNPEFATKEQVTYIAQKFAEMEDIAFTTGATKAQLSTVMDVESFAKMYLIQEFSSNLDSASTSYYITFDCAKTNPVFVANPVWDYDWAYGQYDNSVGKKVDVNGTQLDTKGTNSWVAKNKAMDDSKKQDKGRSLQSQLAGTNSDFKSVIRKVWEETNGFYDKIKQYYSSDGQITSWKNKISSSVNMNETRWGFIKDDLILKWGSVDTGDTFDGEKGTVTALNTWVTNRANWLNTELKKEPEYKTYTPDVPTIKLYDADGKTEISAVEQGKGFIIKVTSPLESNVTYRFFKEDGALVSAESDGVLEFATDDLTVGETYKYYVQAVYNGNTSAKSATVSVTIDDKAGNKQVTIYFKSASASVYVPSLSVDGGASAVMTRDAKTAESNGTYFGSTYSGSLKFYWFYTKMTLDTSVDHTLKFTTKDNRVNASTSYKFVASEGNNYYFAVDNIMGDTNLIDLTNEKEYIRNYHISATHMVHSTTYDNNVGFTWINGKEWAMGTYLKDNNISTANLAELTSSSLLTIPSALTPNAMLEASSASSFFTIKSATLAQRITAEIEEVSTLQYQLLDVNLDGKVDVKDSTMMQKALAGL